MGAGESRYALYGVMNAPWKGVAVGRDAGHFVTHTKNGRGRWRTLTQKGRIFLLWFREVSLCQVGAQICVF